MPSMSRLLSVRNRKANCNKAPSTLQYNDRPETATGASCQNQTFTMCDSGTSDQLAELRHSEKGLNSPIIHGLGMVVKNGHAEDYTKQSLPDHI